MFGRLTLPDYGPVFLNEGTTRSELELRKMEALRSVVPTERRDDLEQDIRLARAGVAGERKIVFELTNSHYPQVFVHDLCLEHEGMRAQIDFLVVTPYHTLVVECKNLVGDIEINPDGSFVRTFGRGRQRRREGIYSPIAQNRRHVELMKAIQMSESGRAKRLLQRFVLDAYYQSVVVLANERTLLTAGDAPGEVREQVIRADQLVEYVRRLDAGKSRREIVETFNEMEGRSRRWLEHNVPRQSDLSDRYGIELPRRAGGGVGGQRVPEAAAAVRSRDALPREAEAPRLRGQSQRVGHAGRANPHEAEAPRFREQSQRVDCVRREDPRDAEVPRCPLCGAPMVVRVARYGERKGKSFWGCSTYGQTRCRGIVNIDG